jgi:hypothetical protein
MGSIDYKKLYLLQDEVLKVIFDTEHEFYAIALNGMVQRGET